MRETEATLTSDPRRLPPDVALDLGFGEAKVVYDGAGAALSIRTTDAGGVPTDRVTIGAKSASPVIVFNEPGADVDVRFEGDTDPSLLVIDAGIDRVGIGGAPDPSLGGLKLHVYGRTRFELDNSGFMTLYRPSSQNGHGIDLNFQFDDSGGGQVTCGTLLAVLVDSSDGSEDGRLDVLPTRAGSYATRAQFGDGLVVGSPSGGDKGAGTINAQAVYDDNVLLTCYPLDAAYGNGVDVAEWDEIAVAARGEGAVHDNARRFDARNLDAEWFSTFLVSERRLPAMPSKSEAGVKVPIGDYMNRVLETLDVLAVHVVSLHERVSELERQR